MSLFSKEKKETMQEKIDKMPAGTVFQRGKHKYKKTSGGNLYKLQTRDELLAHKDKQSRSKYQNSGHYFKPLLFVDDLYVRTTKIKEENFYSVSDVAFHYSRATSPFTKTIQKIQAIIDEDSNTDAQIKRIGSGFIIGNWSALQIFIDIYKPRDYRNKKLKAVIDGEEIYPSNKIATSHSGQPNSHTPATMNSQNTVFPIIMESIQTGKNLAGINKIFENGGLKSLVDEMLDGNISEVLSKYFDPVTVDKLNETDIFDFQKFTAKEIGIITHAIKEKLSLDKNPPAPSDANFLGTVSQLVHELTGKKLVVTFELK